MFVTSLLLALAARRSPLAVPAAGTFLTTPTLHMTNEFERLFLKTKKYSKY
jgi:hypothetical protein